MKKQGIHSEVPERLRQKAEELLKLRADKAYLVTIPAKEPDLLKLVHELEVHQIELELQNKELIIAKEKAELAEEKATELYDFAPSGYISISNEGKILQLNFAAAKMLGKERLHLVSANFAMFVSAETRPVFSAFFQRVFTGKIKQTCEVVLVTEGNLPIYVSINGIVSLNTEFCLLTLTDITESKKSAINLVKAKEKAEECDRLKSAFLANMSHEIRTPMNGILGFADLLKEPGLNGEEQNAYITIIEKSGRRMLNIINQIIDISKIEAGQMELNVKKSDINAQIIEIYNFFKSEAEAKLLQFSLGNTLPPENAIIETDNEKLYAILTNLVKNALKYTGKGSIDFGCMRIETQSIEPILQFYVKDTGIGIPKDRMTAIFERFIQADISDRMAYQGAGLGLAITKAYVEMLGGKIWVESQEGIGSTFYFTLPYNIKPGSETTEIQLTPSENSGNARKLKVLIVEDDEISELLIDSYLKMIGKEILKAKTGTQAVAICRNNRDIDLILMDIRIPGINGYDATVQIREFNKEVIIIAQTAYGLSGDREKALASGCNDYLSKPISKNQLLTLIKKYF